MAQDGAACDRPAGGQHDHPRRDGDLDEARFGQSVPGSGRLHQVHAAAAARPMAMANHMNKTVSTLSLDSPAVTSQMKGTTFHVTPTNQTTTILGHTVHLFKVSSSNPARGTTMSGDMWTATDIPAPRAGG